MQLLALKTEAGNDEVGWRPLAAGKGKEMRSPLEPPARKPTPLPQPRDPQ